MFVPKFFIVPALLLAATGGYIALNPGGTLVRGGGTNGGQLVAAAAATATPVEAQPAATPRPVLPPGLTGTLVYRTLAADGTRQRVAVRFPANEEISREPEHGGIDDVSSADGTWRTHMDCRSASGCAQSLVASDGRTRPLAGELAWAPAGHRYAMRVYADGATGADDLSIIDPETGERHSLNAALVAQYGSGAHIYGFGWDASGDGLIAVTADGAGWNISRFDAEGRRTVLAEVHDLPQYLYRSPDGTKFAYTASGGAGWRMMLFDATARSVRDLGAMGSDGPDGKPVTVGPDQKGPMYVAWAPDSATLAFGGGFDPPYVMHIVRAGDGRVLTTRFPDGYPGEIKWSPAGALIAVSTYNVPRTHHESWLVDPATGVARDVLSGCVIIWSPSGKFLAIHGEKEPGVAIADAETLDHAQLTHTVGDTPIGWE